MRLVYRIAHFNAKRQPFNAACLNVAILKGAGHGGAWGKLKLSRACTLYAQNHHYY